MLWFIYFIYFGRPVEAKEQAAWKMGVGMGGAGLEEDSVSVAFTNDESYAHAYTHAPHVEDSVTMGEREEVKYHNDTQKVSICYYLLYFCNLLYFLLLFIVLSIVLLYYLLLYYVLLCYQYLLLSTILSVFAVIYYTINICCYLLYYQYLINTTNTPTNITLLNMFY
jgi:hypothetical protein